MKPSELDAAARAMHEAAAAYEEAQACYEAQEAAERQLEAERAARHAAAKAQAARDTMRRPRDPDAADPWSKFVEAATAGTSTFAAWLEYRAALTRARDYHLYRDAVIRAEKNRRNAALEERLKPLRTAYAIAATPAAMRQVNTRANELLEELGLPKRDLDSLYPYTIEEFGGQDQETYPTYPGPAGLSYHEAMARLVADADDRIVNEVAAAIDAELEALAAATVNDQEQAARTATKTRSAAKTSPFGGTTHD